MLSIVLCDGEEAVQDLNRIPVVMTYKYLGVDLNFKLTMKTPVKHIERKKSFLNVK